MKWFAYILPVMLSSCGDEYSKPDCSKEDRDGWYRVESSYNGGSCGALDIFYVHLDQGSEITTDCITNYSNWSNKDCTLERSLTCTVWVYDSGTGSGTFVTMDWVQTSTQQDDEGNLFYSNASLVQRGSGFNCSGSYFLTYRHVHD